MMKTVVSILVLLSLVTAMYNGRMEEISTCILQSGEQAIQLTITLAAGICLWSGLMKIAEKAKLTEKVASLLYPITKHIFKGMRRDSAEFRAVSMNLAANLLGLGNAATPLGISAMKEMQKSCSKKDTASDNMIIFVVMNTASIQIIPTTTIFLRLGAGSTSPAEILPAVWFSSLVSVSVGLILALLLSSKNSCSTKGGLYK